MSGGGGGKGKAKGSGDMIPKDAKETIKSVWEITGKKHSDEEIYYVLKECGMDSNEATQKLLYLDTFQEVKRKPKRENPKKEAPQQQGTRGARGNYSSNYKSDVGNGRNASARKENDITNKGSTSLSDSQKGISNAFSHMTRTPTAVSNVSTNLSNGSSSDGYLSKVPADNNKGAKDALPDQIKDSGPPTAVLAVKESTNAGSTRTWASLVTVQSKPLPSSTQSSTSTTARLPRSSRSSTSTTTRLPSLNRSSTSTTAPQPSSNQSLTSTTAPLPSLNRSSTSTTAPLPSSNQSSTSTTASVSGTRSSTSDPVLAAPSLTSHAGAAGTIRSELNNIEGRKEISNAPNAMPSEKASSRSETTEQNDPSAVPLKSSPPEAITSKVTHAPVKDDSKLLPRSNALHGCYVTFPAHFPSSESLEIGMTFGSFGSTFELGITHENGTSNSETTQTDATESSQGSDVTAEEPSPSNQIASSAKQGDTSERTPTPPVLKQVPESVSNIPSTDNMKNMQSNQEIKLQGESNLSLNVENAPSYNLGFMEPQSTSHFVSLDGPEAQPHGGSSFPDFINDSSPAPSSSTPPLSISVSGPPQYPRQLFPPNYYPCGHYQFSPYMNMIPPVHPQFYSPNGIPQQPSTGNVYPSSGALASAVKLSHNAALKPGTTAGSAVPSGYSSFNPLAFGLSHVPATTSSSHTIKEDLLASQMKENHPFMIGSEGEGSGPWMPTPGQDKSSMPHSSMYNHLPFHGQQIAYCPAQAGHGSFAGLYQAPQTMAPPSNANYLLQSQPMAAPSETVGPPNSYQQPQPWTNY